MLSVYLHIPFCRRKCGYCDFFSVPLPGAETLDGYVRQLLRQLELYRDDPRWSGPVSTVFFGGGTPSLLTAPQVAALLDAIDRRYTLAADAEISLEANPETVTPESLRALRRCGVNRLSLGVQSLHGPDLRLLGRGHGTTEALAALAWAADADFPHLGADLIFALPGQSADSLLREVQPLRDLPLDHLSAYGLTLEPGTTLEARHRAGELEPADEESYREQFLRLHQQLSGAGFEHYEISNYARSGGQCRHNRAYWDRQPVLGLGAGAHSFVAAGWGERWAAPDDLDDFAGHLARGEDPQRCLETFDRRGALAETCYLALRTRQGVDDRALRQRFGTDLETAYPGACRRLAGVLERAETAWRFSLEGWLLYNHHIQHFLR